MSTIPGVGPGGGVGVGAGVGVSNLSAAILRLECLLLRRWSCAQQQDPAIGGGYSNFAAVIIVKISEDGVAEGSTDQGSRTAGLFGLLN